MKNDCALLSFNLTSSLLIREAFAKCFATQFSSGVTAGNNNATAVCSSKAAITPKVVAILNGVRVANSRVVDVSTKNAHNSSDVTAAGINETMSVTGVRPAYFKETFNAGDKLFINSSSNTVPRRCNKHQWLLQCTSTLVVRRYNVKETAINSQVTGINGSCNSILRQRNAHHCGYQRASILVYWPTCSMYSPSKPLFSITPSNNYGAATVQPPSLLNAA